MLENLKIIARIRSDFSTKFGIPRQSGLVDNQAEIIFEPEYRRPEALRGLEAYSHLWLIWYFSQTDRPTWSPTVRPPKLGGNRRLGVFATRSPFRPNALGLSCVKLEGIETTARQGSILRISGADLLDGTPILDIKPYLPYTDSYPEASGGFAVSSAELLQVEIPPELLALVPLSQQKALLGVLSNDPRPGYQDNPEKLYSFEFAGFKIRFKVEEKKLRVWDLFQKND